MGILDVSLRNVCKPHWNFFDALLPAYLYPKPSIKKKIYCGILTKVNELFKF